MACRPVVMATNFRALTRAVGHEQAEVRFLSVTFRIDYSLMFRRCGGHYEVFTVSLRNYVE